jgi:hypothetical protein
MYEYRLQDFLTDPTSLKNSRALAMLLRDLFLNAPLELLTSMTGISDPLTNINEVKKTHHPLIGICYGPLLINDPSLGDISPGVLYQKWLEFDQIRRHDHRNSENSRQEGSGNRLYPRPFRTRYELYTQPQYAADLVYRLTYPGDKQISVYFRSEDLIAEVNWNWPLRIGFLPNSNSDELFRLLKTYIDEHRTWIGPLVELVHLNTETDSCDLLLIPTDIGEASDTVQRLGIKISADCVLILGQTTDYREDIPVLVRKFNETVSTAGVGIAPVLPNSLAEWFGTLIKELSHDEPIDVALSAASLGYGLRPPFLMASRKLIEFSTLAESIKSIGEELLTAPPEAAPVSISDLDAEVFGIKPGDYHPAEIGKIFRNEADNFMIDEERKSGARSVEVSRAARRSMRKIKKPAKAEPRWIQAVLYDLSGRTPLKSNNALRAGAPHKAVVRIGTAEAGWIQNREKFEPKLLSPRKTYILTVIFAAPQLFQTPLVSSVELPSHGNSTECEFSFMVPDVEKTEARISIVYKNRVLQTAILKADVVSEPSSVEDSTIEIVPETVVRADLSGLKDRRNFDGAFILNHDGGNAPGLTAIRDKYVSFYSLSELDTFVRHVDEFMTKVADYPEDYAGKLDTPATVTLLCDLAKYGRILLKALKEYPLGNMSEIFSALSPTDPKITQRIQIISAKSDTRLPMEFLYDRKAPARSDAKLCPKAVDALKQDGCFADCDGMKEPERHVCPMGFWGLSKIIERHTYNPTYTEKAVDGSFRFQSEPVEGRSRLDIFRSVLFAASSKADTVEVRSPIDNTVTVEKGGIGKIISTLDTITNSKNEKVTSWEKWCNKIADVPSPTALLLLTHTEKSESVPALEIEEGILVEMQSIEEEYVYSRKEPFPPVVFLIGCETGAADIEFMNFVSQFRRGGAAIIVSTGAPIRGRHAVPVTSELLNHLKHYSDLPKTSFGQVMRVVKQKMLADGFPMVLTLMTYGDADWQIGK